VAFAGADRLCGLGRQAVDLAGGEVAALFEDSVLLDGVDVARDAIVRRAIIDKNVKIPTGARIGVDLTEDRARGYTISEGGVVVLGKGDVVPA
jgi:glucose-1-phosphate adenylyltransferase